MGSVQIMVVLIVLIAVVGGIVKAGLKQERFRIAAGRDSADAQRLDDEVRQLKERIAVLERVITDNHGSIGLDREIERLRDR